MGLGAFGLGARAFSSGIGAGGVAGQVAKAITGSQAGAVGTVLPAVADLVKGKKKRRRAGSVLGAEPVAGLPGEALGPVSKPSVLGGGY